ALVLNAVLSLVLIGRFGVAGAAAGTAASMVVTSCAYIWLFHLRMRASLAATLAASLRPLLPLLPLLAGLWLAGVALRDRLANDRVGLACAAIGLGVVFLAAAAFALARW